MKPTRYYSDLQEKHIAKITDGKIVANSGGTKFGAGDILTANFLIEAKTTTKEKNSFSIKKEWLDKMQEQAFEIGKSNAVLAFRFEPNGKDFYILNENQFLDYLKNLEAE